MSRKGGVSHPKKTKTTAQKSHGGHGGVDFLMDLRLCHCLRHGLPLDMNVYAAEPLGIVTV